jgi:spore maturation protein CgeB
MKYTQQLPSSIYSESTLKKNLNAIVLKNKKLFERICWPVNNTHILFDENLNPVLKIQARYRSLVLSDDVFTGVLSPFDKSKIIFLMGIGNSELIDKTISICPHAKIYVWDRDPWLLRLFLMKKDYSRLIQSGRLVLLLGVDLMRFLGPLKKADKILHPLFEDIYQNEWILLHDGLLEKRVLFCTGQLFVADVADALRTMGYSVFSLDYSLLSLEEIDNVFENYKPHLVFCINYIHKLSEWCERYNTPLLCWEIDPSIDLVECNESKTRHSYIFTYRKKNMDLFSKAGFMHVNYWPLASNPQKRFPALLSEEEKEKYSCRVSFVGESMVNQSQELFDKFLVLCAAFGLDPQQCIARTNNLFQEQRKDFSIFSIPALLQDEFPELFSDPLKLLSFGMNPVMLLGEMAAAEKRLYYMKALEGYAINLWGDAAWKKITGNGAVYRGEAGHHFELNKIYSASLINIDINRIYQNDIVTMRVFDVLACGGFILTEYTDTLKELFKIGDELDTYGSIEELQEKVEYYLNHPSLVQQIAQKGRERVLHDHTIYQRVQKMLKIAGVESSYFIL